MHSMDPLDPRAIFGNADAAPECESLTHPSVANLSFSLLILLGILVSYLPQHHRIIRRGTSEGISPLFLLLGVTSGTCGLLNMAILSWGVVACCARGIGAFNCAAATLGVAQVALQWACFAAILALFVAFFPRAPRGQPPPPLPTDGTPTATPRTAVWITVLAGAHAALFAAGAAALAAKYPRGPALEHYANFLGVQAMALASVQYVPQIATTWRLRRVGSLSIPMMCIQTPGSFVWAVSLAAREGTRWSSWLTYVVTGVLQGVLLVMCVCWEMRERAARRKGLADPALDSDEERERRPLLGDD